MKNRGRPKKARVVQNNPKIRQFSPRGKPGRPDEIELSLDEFEALRLSDYRSESQKKASSQMKISQQTFSRILKKARKTIADAVVNGKIIKIRADDQATLNNTNTDIPGR
jgi:predicted DNA-binding protein (UPF0251 family)